MGKKFLRRDRRLFLTYLRPPQSATAERVVSPLIKWISKGEVQKVVNSIKRVEIDSDLI